MLSAGAESVKSFLEAYRDENERIIDQRERIERLTNRYESVGVANLSAMPRGSGGGDRLTGYLISKESLVNRLRDDVKRHIEVKRAIEDAVGKLPDEQDREVILARYIDGSTWSDVLHRVYGRREDFAERMESYQRQMYRVHVRALEKLAKIW